jgi:hypothetical protein
MRIKHPLVQYPDKKLVRWGVKEWLIQKLNIAQIEMRTSSIPVWKSNKKPSKLKFFLLFRNPHGWKMNVK